MTVGNESTNRTTRPFLLLPRELGTRGSKLCCEGVTLRALGYREALEVSSLVSIGKAEPGGD